MKGKSESEVAQSCPTLSDPMDCGLPGSSVHGIFQARVLEWGAIAFSLCITTNWKILKEVGIPDHFTCLLRNRYAGQEATVRTGHGTTDWLQIGKGAHRGVCCRLGYVFNLYTEDIMWSARLHESQAEVKTVGRISRNDDISLKAAIVNVKNVV